MNHETLTAQGPVDVNVRGGELYMDATDYAHELGECTVELYASLEDLKASRACVAECGIIAVRVEFLRVVEPGIPYRERGKSDPNDEAHRKDAAGGQSRAEGANLTVVLEGATEKG